MEVIKFVPGKTYSTRSICDHNCIFRIGVIKRTAKFLTIRFQGETKRVGVGVYDGVEQIFPTGRYSMAPCVTARVPG